MSRIKSGAPRYSDTILRLMTPTSRDSANCPVPLQLPVYARKAAAMLQKILIRAAEKGMCDELRVRAR